MRATKRAARALAVMARQPAFGKVKTRLAKRLGNDLALGLYLSFLTDTVSKMISFSRTNSTVSLYMFYEGEDSMALADLDLAAFTLCQQEGKSLGERLSRAMKSLLSSHDKAVIIGADSPSIPLLYVERAFGCLDNRRIVLGPSFDGGYYLIGMEGEYRDLFSSVRWGTAQVFMQTLAKIGEQKLDLALLPPWYDVDTLEDLKFLWAHLQALDMSGKNAGAQNTRTFIHHHAHLLSL